MVGGEGVGDQAAAAAAIQGGINGTQARQQFAAQDAAAYQLQGGMAGMQARQSIAAQDAAALTLQGGINGTQARQQVATQDAAALTLQSGMSGMQARNATGEMITAQNNAASAIQAGMAGRGDRIAISEKAKRDAAAASIQASMRGRKSRDAVETLVAEAVKQETLVDVGQRLVACANSKSDASAIKDELQSIIEVFFAATGQCLPGEAAPPSNESIAKKQSAIVTELREKINGEMAEKLEMELELKDAMANSLAMEQELQASRAKIAELQEEAANSFAELEIAKRMTNELQKTAAKEREQLEGENSYLAQQLLLAQQASNSPTRGSPAASGGTTAGRNAPTTASVGLAVRKGRPWAKQKAKQEYSVCA